MTICFPITNDQGLESEVFDHFGSAPMFVVVDSDTQQVKNIVNRDLHHAHGSCSPLKALGETSVDAIVVGGIGGGALVGLQRAGIKVYQAQGQTVAENLACLGTNELAELTPEQTCAAHRHGHAHGCGH